MTAPPTAHHGPLDDRDEAVLVTLRQAWAAVDRPPGFLVDQVRMALGLLDVGAEALRLIEMQQLATSRGEGRTTKITFGNDQLTIMIGVDRRLGGPVRVDGWAVPGGPHRIMLVVGLRSVTVNTDGHGRFAMAGMARGTARLIVGQAGKRQLVSTPLFEI